MGYQGYSIGDGVREGRDFLNEEKEEIFYLFYFLLLSPTLSSSGKTWKNRSFFREKIKLLLRKKVNN